MKKENTASRLREIMETRNLRQVDILNMTRPYCQKYNVKMNKSDISQYCSGKVVTIVVSTVVYFPFVRKLDLDNVKKESEAGDEDDDDDW